jgi:hypothetical protein
MAAKKSIKRKSKRIDVHSHVLPKEMLDALRQRPERFKMRYVEDGKHRRVAKDGGGGQPVFDEFYDAAATIKGMDRKGLDVSVISPAPTPDWKHRKSSTTVSPTWRALFRID